MSKLRLDFPVPWPVRGFLKYVPAGQLAVRATSQAFVEVTLPVAAHFHTAIPLASMIERAALRYMRSQVIDPTVRDKLTPRYALGCKRPSFHNEYLATFNRDNVYLETSPISHLDTTAVHTVDGRSHEIDVLVLATGFKVMDPGKCRPTLLGGSMVSIKPSGGMRIDCKLTKASVCRDSPTTSRSSVRTDTTGLPTSHLLKHRRDTSSVALTMRPPTIQTEGRRSAGRSSSLWHGVQS